VIILRLQQKQLQRVCERLRSKQDELPAMETRQQSLMQQLSDSVCYCSRIRCCSEILRVDELRDRVCCYIQDQQL